VTPKESLTSDRQLS